MTDVALSLIVIRSSDLDRAARFYSLLGIAFNRERHDSGPEHLACRIGPVVLEIYPCDGASPTAAVRLGVQVASVHAAMSVLNEAGTKTISLPKDGPWGLRAVVVDPDGHRIEITESNQQRR
jgi:predicted enzyme related to lactoylglutathione lyase